MYLNTTNKWGEIKTKVVQGIESLFPIEGQKHKLTLVSVDVKEPEGTIKEQRDALLRGENLTASVYANIQLSDLSGRSIDSSKIKILDLPIMTHRGTFVVQGKDYSVVNQVRLRPGVYTRESEDSDTVTSRFNLGKGLGFRIILEPSSSIFYVQFDASKAHTGGQSKIPLYSLARALGASDEILRKEWGEDLYKANVSKANLQEDIRKVVELCVYSKDRTGNDVQDLHKYFGRTVLSPETTKITLGQAFEHVSAQALVEASKKMVKVYKGTEQDDDMDSLLFKEILGAEDHLMLRIEKGARQSNGPLFKIRRKLDSSSAVRDCVPTNFLSKLVESFFTTSSLSSPQTEINPVEILETHSKVTAMGEGGIKSEHGIPITARNLHPSHFGYIDPVRTTESLRVGVDTRMTHNSIVKNRNIYAKFIDKNGKNIELRPVDLVGKVIGFAGQDGQQEVRVLKDGEMLEVPRSQVDYWMKSARDMFTYTSNMVPFLHNDQGNRVTMASRMVTQAVPLTGREEPLVQVSDGKGGSYEKDLGTNYFLPKAPEDGTVREITEDYIKVNNTKVDVYHNFPMNYKTAIDMKPIVKVGDKVKKGQILAESNFTHNGTLALGTNLRTAYIAYKGYNHEDGIVISQSAAKKLTSQHMYTEELDIGPETILDKHKYAMTFPSKITPEQLDKLDESGVVVKGQSLERGDFVMTVLAPRQMTDADKMLQKMHASLANPYRDISIVWHHDRPGKVTDVIRTSKLIKVVFMTEDESRLGDKLSGRHGNKGTITLILPDNEMPYDKDGKPVDMLLNPAGVISRVNPGQLYDTMAGKLAAHRGSPYVVENFSKADSSKKVLGELKAAGLTPEEELIDPRTKKSLGNVFVGNQYTLKLHKQTEGNFGARYIGKYDTNLQPAKGGEDGAKAIGTQEFYALLGHNARNILKEAAGHKSEENREFWESLTLGRPLPPAKIPFVFDKFKALLGATGVNVDELGDENNKSYRVTPMTDKHIVDRSAGETKNSSMLTGNLDNLTPEKGGLFDREVTGGMYGHNWTHINLAEPIAHPLFDKQIKVLLGGKDPSSLSGKELQEELGKIDLDKRIAELDTELKTAKSSRRAKIIKELRYLAALKKMGLKPKDYVLTKFPIIPPIYRPIYASPSGGTPMVADLNNLYRDLINTNDALKHIEHFPDEHKKELRKALSQAAGAVVGVTDPVNEKSKKTGLKGGLTQLVGKNSSKEGFFHRKLLYRTQDLSGRGTILPNPKLHVDECEIPKEMAFKLYAPFIIRHLVRMGFEPTRAAKEVQDRTEVAEETLKNEMKERPVMLNRAPTLHKYNILAFKPKMVEGKSVFIPPLVIKGFGADFDGDSVSGDTWVIIDNDGIPEIVQIKDVE